MKREELVGFGWIVLIYVYMFVVNNFITDPTQQKIAGFLGLFLLFGGMIGQEMYLKMKYAGYKLLRGYIPDYKKEFQFLIKGVEEYKHNGSSATMLILARPFKHPRYGPIDAVIIDAPKSFFETMDFIPQEGALWVYGMQLDHPSVAYAVLRDKHVKVDHANPIPVFDIVFTDKFEPETVTPARDGENMEYLKKELEKLRKLYEAEHQKVIRLEEENAGLRNEVQALLKAKMDFNKQVVEGILAYREAYGDLITAARHLTGRFGGLPMKEILSAIIVLAIVAFLWKNPDFILWFFEHPIQTAIVLIAIGLAGYGIYRRRK